MPDPEPTGVLARALAAQHAGDDKRAVTLFEKFLKANRARADVMAHLAMLCRAGGDSGRAMRWLRAAEKLTPDDPALLTQLAGLLHEGGESPAALKRMRRVAELRPGHAATYYNLGTMAHASGDSQAAIDALRSAVRLAPEDAPGHNNLGLALRDVGRLDEARTCFETALRLAPDYAIVRANLAELMLGDAQPAAALELLEPALASTPAGEDLQRIGARAAFAVGDLERALAHAEALLKLLPRDAAMRRMAALLRARRDEPEAARAHLDVLLHAGVARAELARALLVEGESAAARLLVEIPDETPATRDRSELTQPEAADDLRAAHAQVLLASGELAAAVEMLDHLDAGRMSVAALVALAGDMGEAGLGAQVLPLLEAGALQPPGWAGEADAMRAELTTMLGVARAARGDSDGARTALAAAVELAADNTPIWANAWFHSSRLRRFSSADDVVVESLGARLDSLASDESTRAARIALGFALGKMHEDRGAYEQAFGRFAAANAAARRLLHYDREARAAEVLACTQELGARELARWVHLSNNSTTPVLVVGMMRSGTTLVEQILASHPEVSAAGELPCLPARVRALRRDARRYPHSLGAASDTELAALGAGYVADLDALRGTGRIRVTDKLPSNYMYVGLIATLLPNAKIVYCSRDARDVCWSNFTQRYARGHGYAYDLADLGFEYMQHARMMAHWRAVLPGRFFELRNETLVDDPERVIGALLDYCELPFDARCLRFHETTREAGRGVGTASEVQVRRPLSRASIGRYRPFEPWLGPLFDELGRSAAVV